MSYEKIEKKLPEEILAYIDEESMVLGITRQEAIGRLIQSVHVMKSETETERLRIDLKAQNRELTIKDEEISFLRTELHALHTGLSKLAENLTARNNHSEEHEIQISIMRENVTTISDAIKNIQVKIDKTPDRPFEQHIPLIIIGILAGLLVLYLIISKIG